MEVHNMGFFDEVACGLLKKDLSESPYLVAK